MKIYKRPFILSETWSTFKPSIYFGLFLLIVNYNSLAFWTWGMGEFLAFLSVTSIILPVIYVNILLMLFYIELYEDRIVLVNGILKFWRKEYLFSQYPICGIEYNRGYVTYIIKIRRHSARRLYPHCGIDMVDPRDFKEIISFLESRGVEVITKDVKGLDC